MDRVLVTLPPDTREQARRAVEEHGLSFSGTVARLLAEWVAADSPTRFSVVPRQKDRDDNAA